MGPSVKAAVSVGMSWFEMLLRQEFEQVFAFRRILTEIPANPNVD